MSEKIGRLVTKSNRFNFTLHHFLWDSTHKTQKQTNEANNTRIQSNQIQCSAYLQVQAETTMESKQYIMQVVL